MTALQFLPEDVLFDILSRLDIKSLCMLRCVSKSLKYIISDNPCFTLVHEQIFKQKIHLLFFCRGRNQVTKTRGPLNDYSLKEITSRDEDMRPFLLESCFRNGIEDVVVSFPHQRLMRSLGPLNPQGRLMLYESHFSHFQNLKFLASCRGFIFIIVDDTYYFMTPVSHKIYGLPKDFYVGSGASYGFGYSKLSMEYKVVRFWASQNGCDVLELKEFHIRKTNVDSNSGWRKLHQDSNFPSVHGNGVFAGGYLFWMMKKSDDCLIMEFDLDDNEISFVGYPKLISFLGLMDVNGELGMFGIERKNRSDSWSLDIWILKERKRAFWVKEYRISLGRLPNRVTPLYFGGAEGMLIVKVDNNIYVQDKREELFRKLQLDISGPCCAYWENLAIL